jgi:hypothetical protein
MRSGVYTIFFSSFALLMAASTMGMMLGPFTGLATVAVTAVLLSAAVVVVGAYTLVRPTREKRVRMGQALALVAAGLAIVPGLRVVAVELASPLTVDAQEAAARWVIADAAEDYGRPMRGYCVVSGGGISLGKLPVVGPELIIDPSRALIRRLQHGVGAPVVAGSSCLQGAPWTHRGKAAFARRYLEVTVMPARFVGWNRAEVPVGTNAGPLAASGSTCHLARRHGRWKVTDCRLDWIS